MSPTKLRKLTGLALPPLLLYMQAKALSRIRTICFAASRPGSATWQDDGSGGVRTGADAQELIIARTSTAQSGNTPVNALFSAPLLSGQHFEIDVLESEGPASVGVTTSTAFDRGWRCRGLFFGGGLSNGAALVRADYGDHLTSGMTIGVRTDLSGELATVTFYQDGRCLGPAFVAKRASAESDLFPAVHAGSEGGRFAIRFPPAPATRVREAKKGSSLRHFAEGDWLLKKVRSGAEMEEWPLVSSEGRDATATLKVAAGAERGSLTISLKVVNTMIAGATTSMSAPSDEAQQRPGDGLAIESSAKLSVQGPCASTMMMGPPHLMSLEAALQEKMLSLTGWKTLSSDGTLVMEGDAIELHFEPRGDAALDLPAREVQLP